MKCKYCGKEMSLDDVDYHFKGNKDNYWVCDNCNARAYEMIRYGKSIKVDFNKEDDKMEESNMSEKTNVVTVGVKGIVMFPKYEDGVQKYAIRIDDVQANALNNLVRKQFGAMSLTYGEDEETGEKLLNVKSQFNVPAYDSNGNEFTERINHGAEVVASVVVKEYEVKKRHGVTAYLKGFVVYKNGESQSSTDFKSIMESIIK